MEIKDEFLLKKYMPSSADIQTMSTFFYAFSDLTRLKIIISLMLKPLCVGEISYILDVNQTTVSHQLKILKSLGIVECKREGKNVIYFIKNVNIESVLNASVGCI